VFSVKMRARQTLPEAQTHSSVLTQVCSQRPAVKIPFLAKVPDKKHLMVGRTPFSVLKRGEEIRPANSTPFLEGGPGNSIRPAPTTPPSVAPPDNGTRPARKTST